MIINNHKTCDISRDYPTGLSIIIRLPIPHLTRLSHGIINMSHGIFS